MTKPDAIAAKEAPARQKPSNYPAPFADRVKGRTKQPLGDVFGLSNFGVNLTCLAPGAHSALHHSHSLQDEMVYVLEGHPTLVTDTGETLLAPGMVAGFPKGGQAHHLENRSQDACLILEIGDRTKADAAHYPRDDLMAVMGQNGAWQFAHKDGKPY